MRQIEGCLRAAFFFCRVGRKKGVFPVDQALNLFDFWFITPDR